MAARHSRSRVAVATVCIASLVTGCVSSLTAIDAPLDAWTPALLDRSSAQTAGNRSSDLLVLVAFSGGGTRAAAFAYGVLQELRDTRVETDRGSRRLLNEIDIVSSVSGGSFTSAYFALRGERMFDDFEERFLRKNVEGGLIGQVFRPLNWLRLFSETYTRSEIAANYYDEHLFDDATFKDFQRPDTPLVVINATELPSGERFSFGAGDFGYICADIDQYPVSRAVAASSAVPVVLSPVTLENFAGTCGFTPDAWVEEAMKDQTLTTRRLNARAILALQDKKKRPYLHLVDGGIADNLGLRPYYDVVQRGDPQAALQLFDHPDARHILMISVNARAQASKDWALDRDVPSLAEILSSVSADQIERYSVDTVELARNSFDQLVGDVSTTDRPLSFDFVEVSFEAVSDADDRAFLNRIGTNFDLDDEQVDALLAAARTVLRGSPAFQSFLGRAGGQSLSSDAGNPGAIGLGAASR